jgi:Mn2+/Fe2+ NRAMP family transporter
MATAASIGVLGLPAIALAWITAGAGLTLLSGWMWHCRDCRAIRYLQRYFAVLGVVLVALAPVLLGVGQPGAAVGAGLNAILFALIVGALTLGANRLDCPLPPAKGAR